MPSINAVANILFFDVTKADEELFENYLVLSLLLANRLNELKHSSKKKFDTLLFIDKPTLAQLNKTNKLDKLNKAFDKVIVSENHEAYFLKLEVWKSITEYDSIVYLDSDCYIKSEKTLDLLFEETLSTKEQFAACNESTWPDMFNTGVFAINNKTALSYEELINHSEDFTTLTNANSEEVELFDSLDQGLFNYAFSDSWNTLSYVYNVQVRDTGAHAGSQSPSDTYFVNSGYNNSKPGNSPYFDSGYFTYANNASANKDNKFMKRALIVQFMDKPWKSGCMGCVAPEYYSSFVTLKESMAEKEEEVDVKSIEEGVASISVEEVAPVKEEPAFDFPWSITSSLPTTNTREWRPLEK